MMRKSMACMFLAVTCYMSSVQAYPACSGAHCSVIDHDMNTFCTEQGMAGKPYLVIGLEGGRCTCICSCFAAETRIAAAKKGQFTVTELAEGDMIDAPFSTSDAVVSHRMSSMVTKYPVHVLRFDNGEQLIVSHNHTFVRPDLTSVTADQLRIDDPLLTGAGQTKVVAVERARQYDGAMQNLIMNGHSHDPLDHLLVTNGVLSGDYWVQIKSDTVGSGVDLRMDILDGVIR